MSCRVVVERLRCVAAEAMSQPKLFEDTFEVKEIDRDGKKFDKGTSACDAALLAAQPGSRRTGRPLHGACRMLHFSVVSFLLHGACCMLHGIRLHVSACLLHVACGMRSVA